MFTLSKPVIVSGQGLHSGNPVDMVIAPASSAGIRFLYNGTKVPVTIDAISNTNVRATMLCANGVTIQTPEHFL